MNYLTDEDREALVATGVATWDDEGLFAEVERIIARHRAEVADRGEAIHKGILAQALREHRDAVLAEVERQLLDTDPPPHNAGTYRDGWNQRDMEVDDIIQKVRAGKSVDAEEANFLYWVARGEDPYNADGSIRSKEDDDA